MGDADLPPVVPSTRPAVAGARTGSDPRPSRPEPSRADDRQVTRVRTRTAAVMGLSLLALAACSASDAPPAAMPDPPPVEAPLPPPAEDIPGPAPPPSAEPRVGDCGDQVVAEVDEVIAGQLAALAADDHERALGFASEDFRASFDAAAFEALIDGSYPVVADAAEHRVDACQQRDAAAAQVRVTVTASDGEHGVFVYLLVDEDGWAIAGAVEVEAAAPDVTDV